MMKQFQRAILFSLLFSFFVLPFHGRAHADVSHPNTEACQVCKTNVLPVSVPAVSILFHASYSHVVLPEHRLVVVSDVLASASPRAPPR